MSDIKEINPAYKKKFGKTGACIIVGGYKNYDFINISEDEIGGSILQFGKDSRCAYSADSYVNRVKQVEDAQHMCIHEALIKTYPAKKLMGEVAKELEKKLEDWQYNCEIEVDSEVKSVLDYYYVEDSYSDEPDDVKTAGIVLIGIPMKSSDIHDSSTPKKVTDAVIRLMKLFGYDKMSVTLEKPAGKVTYNGEELDVMILMIQFEARNQTDNFKLNNFLYHITTADKRDKILKQGLMPKTASEEFEYEPRVYLFNTDDFKYMMNYMREAKKDMKRVKGQVVKMSYIMFKIDPSKVPHLKLHVDNATPYDDRHNPIAVWTQTNIPPSAVMQCKSLDGYLS